MSKDDQESHVSDGFFGWERSSDASSSEAFPEYAYLPDGVTTDDLCAAITQSGYPLQAAIANALRDSLAHGDYYLTMQEEWAYVDSDTGQVRSIDIFAELPLVKPPTARPLSVTPYLNLLVECKQSEMPYIFFLRGEAPGKHYDFPEIGGLPNLDLTLFSEEDGCADECPYAMSLYDVYSVGNLDFFEFPCPFAINISKVVRRKSGGIELTGDDSYRSLTLPLMKAADHLKQVSQPQTTSADSNLACRIIICLAVLRAPMFGVARTGQGDNLSPLPWVRVCRLEPQQPGLPFRTVSNVRYYDCVHEAYLPDYLIALLSDVEILASRIEQSGDVILDGKGVSARDDEEVYPTLRRIGPQDSRANLDVEPIYRIARTRPSFRLIPPGAGQGNAVQEDHDVEGSS
jgi:hypothetical protein